MNIRMQLSLKKDDGPASNDSVVKLPKILNNKACSWISNETT